ncbi:MAG: zf-HC2 domain-containing protein, partial [candidate division KSB1 bacterium]|nr:zf-HC2 domain-containing protein [candidate division KSB1 bacterium]
MKNCKHFRQQLIVATYHELSAEDLALLQQHLAQCQACQTEAAELGAIMNLLQLKVQLEPTDRQLEANRSELHRRLLLKKQRSSSARFWTRVWQLVSLDFAPSIRFAAALGLLVIGIFLGRTFLPSNTAYSSQLMELAESNLAQVQAIEYNQQTRQVSIQFNAINHVTIEGDLDRSEIQRLLAQVLV